MSWRDTIKDESKQSEVSSWRDTISDIPEEDTSFIPESLKAGAAGAAESATFGFAPEIGAGVQALKSALPTYLGGEETSDLKQDYKKYEAENEAAFRKLEQENSGSFLAGELLGGVAQGALTGGLGTAAKVVQGVGKAAPLIGRLALTGAGTGALSGVGYSKESAIDALSGDTEAQKELAKDVAIGAGVGAAGNVVMPYVAKSAGEVLKAGGKAASGALNAASKKIDTLADLQKAYKYAKKGISVTGSDAEKAIRSEGEDVSKEILKGFDTQMRQSSEKMGEMLRSVPGTREIPDLLENIQKARGNKKIIADELSKLNNIEDQYKQLITTRTLDSGEERAFKEFQMLKEKIINESEMLGNQVNITPMGRSENYLKALKTSVNKEGELIPEPLQMRIDPDKIIEETTESFKDMNLEDLYNYKKAQRQILKSEATSDVAKNEATATQAKVDEFIKSKFGEENYKEFLRQKGLIAKGYEAEALLPELDDKKLKSDTYVKLSEALLSGNKNKISRVEKALAKGTDEFVPSSLKEEAMTISERMGLNKRANITSSLGMSPAGLIMGPIGSASVRTGELVGASTRIAGKLSQTPKDFTKKMLGMTESGLVNMASKLPKVFADSITTALKDSTKKDRLMWAISQQPAFREAVNRLTDEDETVNLEPLDVNVDN